MPRPYRGRRLDPSFVGADIIRPPQPRKPEALYCLRRPSMQPQTYKAIPAPKARSRGAGDHPLPTRKPEPVVWVPAAFDAAPII